MKRCQRCNSPFIPIKPHYRYCEACYPDVAPQGNTTARIRAGAAARIHGGVWRQSDNRRPLELRGDTTIRNIFQGLTSFLTDLYQRSTRISTLLQESGMSNAEIGLLREDRRLDDFALRFCPKLWEWLSTTVGSKARTVLIDYYGLYGDERCDIERIARLLEIEPDYAGTLRGWALKKIRSPEKRTEFEEIVISTAHDILPESQ